MKIFGLAGRRACGKDSTNKIIARLLETTLVKRIAFADALKDFCGKYLGVPRINMYGDKGEKEEAIGQWKDFFGFSFPQRPSDVFNSINPSAPVSARFILQYVGTDIFRRFFKNSIWIDYLVNEINSWKNDFPELAKDAIYCITDVRFANEINAIKGIGGKVIKLYRDTGFEHQSHPSEAELDKIPDTEFDYIITKEQNINLQTLEERIKEILKVEGLL